MRKKTNSDKESMKPYDRMVRVNKQYGFTPNKPVYIVTGRNCYGVYDDYGKLKYDIQDSSLKKATVTREDSTAWKAIQKCYSKVIRETWPKYIYEPITKANEMVVLHPVGRLFEKV